jgi:uncharacterized protein (DUF302 family)
MPDATSRVTAALAAEGFGVLTHIDVRATLKKKLDVDTRPYVILGACAPPFALQALSAEPAIGLLLPCNVVVADDGAGGSTLSAIDPEAMLSIVPRDGLEAFAHEVKARLERALGAA